MLYMYLSFLTRSVQMWYLVSLIRVGLPDRMSLVKQKYWNIIEFSQLGNSAISVKGKSLTNFKMYVERKVYFLKVKFNFKVTKCQVSVVQQV